MRGDPRQRLRHVEHRLGSIGSAGDARRGPEETFVRTHALEPLLGVAVADSADEATRLIDFKNQVGTNAILSSICDGDLSVALMKATMLFQSACGDIIL